MSKIYRSTENSTFEPILFADFDGGGGFGIDEARDEAAMSSEAKTAGSSSAEPMSTPTVDVEALEKAAFEKGRQAGRQEAEALFGQSAQALAEAAIEISQLRESLHKSSVEDMLRLVMAIAERVIHVEVEKHSEMIVDVIERALKAAIKADEYHIRVNPQDLEVVKEKKPLFIASISGLKNIIFEGDAAIARGGCLVESTLGQVDATLESQLAQIRQHLAEQTGHE
ncbi:FliH/SctL family protein [Desulfuromonas sp. AOP6]|uniref:FliH/SctL family protein n=1 Tax=Desulfuromonas sp. AOP6 TaxID=1566351 RepID=UPI00127FC5CA|nr:FliH/SctL family protein [Desulfuromonas sp. AOP6]BCA79108.1 hypothetical protein AOP6_0895 [Desulfuromonas sp. AOP6]